MRSNFPFVIVKCLGALLFVAAIVYPLVALVVSCLNDGGAPEGGFVISGRLLGLLWRSVWLSSLACLLAIALSVPVVCFLANAGRGRLATMFLPISLMLLLCSPMVYAFGWDGVINWLAPESTPPTKLNIAELSQQAPTASRAMSSDFLSGHFRCVLLWAMWLWPLPSCIMYLGWSGRGRRAYEAALLDLSARDAFLRVVLREMSPWALFSSLVVFLFLINEYSVPHACGLTVYATELLSWASQSSRMIDTLWPAVPQLVLVAILLFVAMTLRRRIGVSDLGTWSWNHTGKIGIAGFIALGLLLICWVVPISALIVRVGSVSTVSNMLSTYGGDVAATIGVAVLAGVVSVAVGVSIAGWRRWKWLVVFLFFLMGAWPGALIGMSLIAAYNTESLAWVYDHWLIVLLAYIARFGWIGVLAGLLSMNDQSRRTLDQAAIDGANPWQILTKIAWPLSGAFLICMAMMVAAFSVGDVSASSLVRVPGFNPIAHVIIEKFHRFEDGMLVTLSLAIVITAVPSSVILWRKLSAG